MQSKWKQKWIGSAALLGGFLLLAGCEGTPQAQAEASGGPEGVPQFRVDPYWPLPLPEDWILGQVAGMSIDENDHIWIVHRGQTVQAVNAGAAQNPPVAMCCTPAPPVLEFDPAGNVVRAWGGPSDRHDWPTSMHGIHIDYKGFVWLAGNGADDHFILKFTRDGEFVMQIGAAGKNEGSHDTRNLGGPATLLVDPETDELYVADGYQNRRIIVFDANTGEYRRHWGAFGEVPDDTNPGPYDPAVGPSRTFRTPVHGLIISHDGLVYTSDRPNNRIQVFTKSGEFVREAFIRPETLGPGSTWYFGLSKDPLQRWLYVPDGTNNVIWILDRETLEVVHYFGRGGRAPGQFDWLHDLVVDSHGNLFTTEVQTGHRIQKFELVSGG
jgi:DNA-binding beta-propeller fold protein YncE